jgi:hypothetical protein
LAAVELFERNLSAVAVGAGGLVGIGVAFDRSLDDVIDVNVEDNEIRVNVAAVASAAGCRQYPRRDRGRGMQHAYTGRCIPRRPSGVEPEGRLRGSGFATGCSHHQV